MDLPVSRQLWREPRETVPLPKIVTHADWCRWLSSRGALSPRHRGCLHAGSCVATDGPVHPVGSWEGRRALRT